MSWDKMTWVTKRIRSRAHFGIKGRVSLVLRDKDGKVKKEVKIENLIVTAGKNFLANWLGQSSQAGPFMPFIAIGSGATAPSASDTGLESELTRQQGAISFVNNIWTNSYTFLAGDGTGTVTEAGLFSANPGGTMMARTTFGDVTKAAGDTLQVTWNITLG